jgi:hypothetical protein
LANRLTIVLAFTVLCFSLRGQEHSNLRKRNIELYSDTITLDTLSIIPSSFTAFDSIARKIDSSLFLINFGSAQFYPSDELRDRYNSIVVEYRVFPLLFETSYAKREYEKFLSPDSLMGREPPRYRLGEQQENLFDDQIRTNGSIMRGIRFGNNQNLSVNSSMNLTFEGELGKQLMIEGAISDQSIPLQPEGTTRRLDEFDRIFIRVHRKDFSIQAGDIELRAGGQGQFLSFNRNVQGLAYSGLVSTGVDTLSIVSAFAVPKGKFARNQIQGIEGNQGPYRLKGTNGEPYIIILSGSERIYIDGTLLTRGDDQHYTIDYNAAEVTFTHRAPINANSRIVVEFEYSERSYARFNTFAHVQNKGKKWGWNLSVFSEQDSRNQPFDQELNDSQKKHLASIGDNLNEAFFPQEDKVDYTPDVILYEKLDSIVNGNTYSIYRYSTNPSLTQYRVFFTFVGQGNGNYTPDFGTANGRIYRWVTPQNGTPQGSYEPIRRLVTPQKKQMVQAGLSRKWHNNSYLIASYALSNTDLNTFSPLDSDDNIGQGLQLAIAHNFNPTPNELNVSLGANYLKTDNGFKSIDRFRPVEFERNWSITAPLDGPNEKMVGVWVEMAKPNKIHSKINGENLSVGNWFKGNRGSFSGWARGKIISTNWDALLVTSSDTARSTQFKRAKVELKNTRGFLTLGVLGEMENSRAFLLQSDSLLPQSFSWYQLKTSINTPDTLATQATIWYILRDDYRPYQSRINHYASSQELALRTQLNHSESGSITSSIGYRLYSPNSNLFPNADKEMRTVLAQMDYTNRLFKGFWIVAGHYQLGSGLEPDMEYYFVEVPAGQGVYTWVDYNGNGVMELAEFEIANYPDEARFIRINIPGSKMISIRNNALSLRSNINLAAILKDKKGLLNQISKISNNTSFKAQQKNRFDEFWQSANPIIENVSDTLIVSMNRNFRNSLAYNRSSRRFGFEYIFMGSASKSILANGFEQREINSHRGLLWFGMGSSLSFISEAEEYKNTANSQYFITRNYSINGSNLQQTAKYLTSKNHSFQAVYKWSKSTNTIGNEELLSHSFSLQTDFAFAGKGSIMGKSSYVTNDFTGTQQTAVAYEMMKGLQAGKNVIWEVSIRRRLSKLFELELGYNGRYLSDGSVVHSGSMQARAIF